VRRTPGISIVTPDDWEEFDLNPATRHRSVVRAVRRACASDHSLDAAPLIAVLDHVVGKAVSAGGFYLAAAASRGANQHPFASSVFMQLSPPRPSYREAPSAVCADLAADLAIDLDLADCDVSVVTLPLIGPSVRVEGASQGVLLNYIVPLRYPARDLTVTFNTQCWLPPDRQAATLALFETMALSIAVVRGD
jgi:hypothetical protein